MIITHDELSALVSNKIMNSFTTHFDELISIRNKILKEIKISLHSHNYILAENNLKKAINFSIFELLIQHDDNK